MPEVAATEGFTVISLRDVLMVAGEEILRWPVALCNCWIGRILIAFVGVVENLIKLVTKSMR